RRLRRLHTRRRDLRGLMRPIRTRKRPMSQQIAPQQTATPAKKAADKVIITCAETGGIHTPTMSDALPYRPQDIAEQAVAAAEAAAGILRLHVRDTEDGRPTPDPAVFMQFLPRIKQATDAVVNITTGGGLNMTVEQRLAAPLQARPEMCSLNM